MDEKGKKYGEQVRKNEGYDFELQIAGLLENKGYSVELIYTGVSKIISFHARNDEEDYAVYCSGKDQRVTRREIDKLIKEVLDYDMSKGLFFSLSDFSDGAKEAAEKAS